MYTFKTDFLVDNFTVAPDDANKLISVSHDIAQYVSGQDLKNYTLEIIANVHTSDPIDGNIYRIITNFNTDNNESYFSISYFFKLDNFNKPFFHSCNFYTLDYNNIDCQSSQPMPDEFPDSSCIYFIDDFKINYYKVNYRQTIRHFLEEVFEDDKISVLDFIFTVSDKRTDLTISYNHYKKNSSPIDFFEIKKNNLTKTELLEQQNFYRLLRYVGFSSVFVDLFPDFITENLTNAVEFKRLYLEFINNFNEELIKHKFTVLQMERI